MSFIDHWGFGAVAASHFARPCIAMPALRHLALVEFGHSQEQSRRAFFGVPGQIMHRKLLATLAAAHWAFEHLEQYGRLESGARSMRAAMSAVHFSLISIQDPWDSIVALLDCHFATKRGQLRGVETPSLNSLYKDLDKPNSKARTILPTGVVSVIEKRRGLFRIIRNVRNDLVHYGGDVGLFVRANEYHFHVIRYQHPGGWFNSITREVDDFADLKLWSYSRYICFILAEWFQVWHELEPFARELLPPNADDLALCRAPFGFSSDYVYLLHELMAYYEIVDEFDFLWPCGPDCKGSLGGCRNSPGDSPTRSGWSFRLPDAKDEG